MTDKVQQNIDRIRKLAASPAASKGGKPTISRSRDSLAKVIRNERESAIFFAELNAVLALECRK